VVDIGEPLLLLMELAAVRGRDTEWIAPNPALHVSTGGIASPWV
jgi:hypothetical protein